MRRIDLVRNAVAEQLNDPYDLLAMRLIFPPDWSEVKIEREISDLYVYPERLEASYCDEWRAIAVRAVFKHGFSDHWRSDEENLDLYFLYLRQEAIPRCIHNHIDLFRSLGEVLQIEQSGNTIRFPDARRRALMKIIWPEV
jgi:hypothetical protein